MFGKVLVPLDGSKLAEQLLPHAAELAGAFGSEVVLVGVCEPEDNDCSAQFESNMDSYVGLFRSYLGQRDSVAVRRVLLHGKPGPEIVRFAEEGEIDLIIMGSHGRSGIAPWSLGGTVAHVVHQLRAPLLIFRSKETPEDAQGIRLFSRILLPLDGSKRGEAALPYISALVERLGSEAVLMQAVAHGRHVHTVGGLDYIRFDEHEISMSLERAEEYLRGAGARLSRADGKVSYQVRDGDPVTEIMKCAEETECQLIAMSTHGHSFIDRWVYGSTTNKLLQTGQRSILLVPAPEQ